MELHTKPQGLEGCVLQIYDLVTFLFNVREVLNEISLIEEEPSFLCISLLFKNP
jgi:hypothetical protein